MKRTRDRPRRFLLKKLLGAGTYNCAYYITEDETVLRIGFLPYSERETGIIVKRGLEMVHVFQSFLHMLGPSLIEEVSKYQIIDANDLDKHVEGELCPSILTAQADPDNVGHPNEVALQHIEFLRGGIFTRASLKKNNIRIQKKELCFITFSLLWFFGMAQQLFSYRHHDLKGENMMIRITAEAKEYVFELPDPQGPNPTKLYRFVSNIVPVVIDYDFASVYTTKGESSRNSGGTYYTRAPDSLLYSLYGEVRKPLDFPYNAHAYDYWSLGMCLLELMCDFTVPIYQLFDVEATEFAGAVKDKSKFFPPRVTQEFLRYFFYGLCFAAAVSKKPYETSLEPPRELYGSFVDEIGWDAWNTIIHESIDYKEVVDEFQKKIPSQMRAIVRKLLSIDPTLRTANNNPMYLITNSTFFDDNLYNPKKKEGRLVAYKGRNGPVLSDKALLAKDEAKLRGISFLEGALCASCQSVVPQFLCECCAKPFCGRGCQEKTH